MPFANMRNVHSNKFKPSRFGTISIGKNGLNYDPKNDEWIIRKKIDGKLVTYGPYKDPKQARKIHRELKSVDRKIAKLSKPAPLIYPAPNPKATEQGVQLSILNPTRQNKNHYIQILVDSQDAAYLESNYTLRAYSDSRNPGKVIGSRILGRNKTTDRNYTSLSRILMKPSDPSLRVFHKNGNYLDFRRSNLVILPIDSKEAASFYRIKEDNKKIDSLVAKVDNPAPPTTIHPLYSKKMEEDGVYVGFIPNYKEKKIVNAGIWTKSGPWVINLINLSSTHIDRFYEREAGMNFLYVGTHTEFFSSN